MLNIAFDELTRGGTQELRTRNVSSRHRERHYVLQLIPETVGSAGLVKGGASQNPA